MIKLDDNGYYVKGDSYGMTLFYKETKIRENDDPDGKYQKDDTYETEKILGHHSTMPAILRIYLRELTRNDIMSDEVITIKEWIKSFDELKKDIIKRFKL